MSRWRAHPDVWQFVFLSGIGREKLQKSGIAIPFPLFWLLLWAPGSWFSWFLFRYYLVLGNVKIQLSATHRSVQKYIIACKSVILNIFWKQAHLEYCPRTIQNWLIWMILDRTRPNWLQKTYFLRAKSASLASWPRMLTTPWDRADPRSIKMSPVHEKLFDSVLTGRLTRILRPRVKNM